MVREVIVMSNDVKGLLEELVPLGAPTQLRSRVLGAAANELRRPVRLMNRLRAAVAAALLVGLGLNYAVSAYQDERLAQVIGPPPQPRAVTIVAETIAPFTDAETAEILERQWSQAYWQHQKALLRNRVQTQSEMDGGDV
jgi:hypothetical protein